MEDALIQVAETIQTASINRAPSPRHDLNNSSTAASSKQPVTISHSRPLSHSTDDGQSIQSHSISADEEISSSVIHPVPRRTNLPPLPDLRFEQSYLASISRAESRWMVAWITVRDQVMLPLIQGTLWTLALQGWRFWNQTASYNGKSLGSKLRIWWYGVNDWKIPVDNTAANGRPAMGSDARLAEKVDGLYSRILGIIHGGWKNTDEK